MLNNLKNKKMLFFSELEPESPFFFPIIYDTEKQRNVLKNILINNKIYVPIHWDISKIIPNDYFREHDISQRILSIPIDQRYSSNNMKFITYIINKTI